MQPKKSRSWEQGYPFILSPSQPPLVSAVSLWHKRAVKDYSYKKCRFTTFTHCLRTATVLAHCTRPHSYTHTHTHTHSIPYQPEDWDWPGLSTEQFPYCRDSGTCGTAGNSTALESGQCCCWTLSRLAVRSQRGSEGRRASSAQGRLSVPVSCPGPRHLSSLTPITLIRSLMPRLLLSQSDPLSNSRLILVRILYLW